MYVCWGGIYIYMYNMCVCELCMLNSVAVAQIWTEALHHPDLFSCTYCICVHSYVHTYMLLEVYTECCV